MEIVYRLKTDTIYDEERCLHTVYGIVAVDTFGKVITSFSDVFFDKSKAEHLVTLYNRENLSPIHLEDIIKDALTEQYTV